MVMTKQIQQHKLCDNSFSSNEYSFSSPMKLHNSIRQMIESPI